MALIQSGNPKPAMRACLSFPADCLIGASKALGALMLCSVLNTLSLSAAVAQTSAAQQEKSHPKTDTSLPTSYDVMSVKINKSVSDSSSTRTNDGRFTAVNVSLEQLLGGIYDMKPELISGLTGPIASARFDITAAQESPDIAALQKMTPRERWQMLLPLLTERFSLKTHTETKVLPVYELTVLPSGPKFKLSAQQTGPNGGSTSTNGNNGRVTLTAHEVSMTSLAKTFSGQIHRTVLDRTFLSGSFDVEMRWSTDNAPETGAETLPLIFTAVQEQLGLKLVPAKGPVETLVVDQVSMPTEN